MGQIPSTRNCRKNQSTETSSNLIVERANGPKTFKTVQLCRQSNGKKKKDENAGEAAFLTDAAGDGAVPLGQSVGDRQTFDGARSLQNVARAAFKADHGPDSEVVPHAPAVSGLRDRAALGGAGLWNSFRENK